MCGRAAYSARALSAAATGLSNRDGMSGGAADSPVGKPPPSREAAHRASIAPISLPKGTEDRPNASPGNVFHVFRRSRSQPAGASKQEIESTPMIWGLIPHDGTIQSPHLLPTDPHFTPSPHYKIFNARSETVYVKPSFRGSMRDGKTCVLAVEGYYEWTTSQSPGDKRKQPYFVRRRDGRPLLLAGVWARVRTGRKANPGARGGEEETMTTFAILTTDAHPDLAWIHPRQPVMLPDASTALEWLRRPTPALVENLRSIPSKGTATTESALQFWETVVAYPVSKRVNDAKYRGDDCTAEVKVGKRKSGGIESFFSPGGSKKAKVVPKQTATSDARSSEKIPSSSRPHPCEGKKEDGCKEGNATADQEDVAQHDGGGAEKAWTCTKCTYVHVGSAKFEYLACEVCGSERT